ncbi:SEC10/PgrA surface exclusion domain-containing protein [Limosilactobacillus sp.]|uniref:SEC10/PgrA surface exclusion domain-containing protein n=1 Tax=Limosilactobacillus sp. TaxID=2773925 RepID=UPI00345EF67A
MKNKKFNVKKNLLVTTVVLAAIAGGSTLAGQTAHAATLYNQQVSGDQYSNQSTGSQSTDLTTQQSASQNYASAQAINSQSNNTDNNQSAAIKAAQNVVNDAQAQKDSADAKVSAAQNELNTKQTDVYEDTEALKDVQNALNGLEHGKTVVDTITLDVPAYRQYFKDMYDNNTPTNQDKISLKKMYDTNRFKGDPADEFIKINPNNLTESQQLELTGYAANILNNVREQLGLQPVVITKGALKFATDSKNNSIQAHWNKTNHDVASITKAARENGLNDRNNYYECASYFPGGGSVITLSDAKSGIYYSLKLMILGVGISDSNDPYNVLNPDRAVFETLHAQALLDEHQDNISQKSKDNLVDQGTQQDFAIQMTKQPSGIIMFHFNNITNHNESRNNNEVVDPTKYDETIVPINENNSNKVSILQKVIQNAMTNLSASQQALTQAQNILSQAKSEQTTANAKLNQAKANLQKLQAKSNSNNNAITNGWNLSNGTWYYYHNGVRQTGW